MVSLFSEQSGLVNELALEMAEKPEAQFQMIDNYPLECHCFKQTKNECVSVEWAERN